MTLSGLPTHSVQTISDDVDSYRLYCQHTASITDTRRRLINEDGETPEAQWLIQMDLIATPDPLAGQIVYIRRLQDNRSAERPHLSCTNRQQHHIPSSRT